MRGKRRRGRQQRGGEQREGEQKEGEQRGGEQRGGEQRRKGQRGLPSLFCFFFYSPQPCSPHGGIRWKEVDNTSCQENHVKTYRATYF